MDRFTISRDPDGRITIIAPNGNRETVVPRHLRENAPSRIDVTGAGELPSQKVCVIAT